MKIGGELKSAPPLVRQVIKEVVMKNVLALRSPVILSMLSACAPPPPIRLFLSPPRAIDNPRWLYFTKRWISGRLVVSKCNSGLAALESVFGDGKGLKRCQRSG